jgi:segregation and condensation protein B
MDEISRELPPDTTTGSSTREHRKGPEEVVAFERGEQREDLVVRDRFGAPAAEVPVSDETVPAGPAAPEPEGGRPEEPAAKSVPETGPETVAEAAFDEQAVADAVAQGEEVVEIEEDLGAEEDGLPAVPELGDAQAVARIVLVLMLTSRESLSVLRLAQACNTTQKLVEEALVLLQDQLQQLGLCIELARTGDSLRWMSSAEAFPYLQRLRGVKKLEKLSPAALETLAVIAYRQPVMRGEIEAIRGVKAGPMLRTLLQHKLVKVTGRADVPGRPLQYGTTPQFLERFGISSLQELPSVKEWKNLG